MENVRRSECVKTPDRTEMAVSSDMGWSSAKLAPGCGTVIQMPLQTSGRLLCVRFWGSHAQSIFAGQVLRTIQWCYVGRKQGFRVS